MLGPLVILAILALGGGWIGIERFGAYLAPVVGPVTDPALESGGKSLDYILSGVAVATALLGLLIAHIFYFRKNDRASKLAAAFSGPYNLLVHKYWIDELYQNVIVTPITLASRYILGWVGEGIIIRGSTWLLGGTATLFGELFRRWQSGNLRSYSAWLAAGASALILFAFVGAVLGVGVADLRMVWVGH